jgi:hypothetical protein
VKQLPMNVRWLVPFVVIVGASGCSAGPRDVFDGPAEDGSRSSTSAALGADRVSVEWDSTKTDNLSAWKDLSCYDDYGKDFMLAGLKA